MERFLTLLIPAFLTVVLLRVLLMPAKLVVKAAAYSGCGLACLWLMNCVAAFTGIYIPVNAVTVLVAGFLGLPGMGLLAILAVM